jgi:hypothetical protein
MQTFIECHRAREPARAFLGDRKTSQRCERFVFVRDKETMYVPAVFRTAAILRDVKSQHHDGFPCPPLLKYRCLAPI